ncbi:5024_t:CDS:1, partial [Rhizophagus irregularis]
DTTTFPITLGKIVILDDIQYDISEFRISNLKRYIFSKKKESKLSGISDPDDLNLWQVNVSKDKLEGVYTTEHITNELKGKKMDE